MARKRKSAIGSRNRSVRRRKRDYRAEYARRIARALARGLSRSQARGHPKASERHSSAKRRKTLEDRRLQLALKSLRKGQSLKASAHNVGLSTERLRHLLNTTGAARKRGRRWIVRDDLPRQMLLYSNGEAIVITVSNRRAAALVGLYMNSVKRFLITQDPADIAIFRGKSVTDSAGKGHPFETDPNTLYRLDSLGSDSFELVYRIVL